MKRTTVFWRQDGSQSSRTHLEIRRSFPCRVQLSTFPLFACLKRGDDPLVTRCRIQTMGTVKISNDSKCAIPTSEYQRTCHLPSLPFAYSNWTSSTLRFSLLWDVTQRRLVVVPEQSIGPICKGTLRNVSEQRRPPIQSGERLKSDKFHIHTHTKWVNWQFSNLLARCSQCRMNDILFTDEATNIPPI